MKKTVRLFLVVGALVMFAVAPAIAQDTTTAVTTASTGGVLQWLKNNWYIVLPAVYEIIVRVLPTASDWSWLNLIKSIIDWLIANKKPNGAKHA